MEFLALFFVLIIAFFVGSCAGSSIAGLEEKRLIDFELSQPLSRTKLLISNVILGLISIAVLTLSTSGVMYLLSKLYGISELSEKGILSFAVTATFFMWAIFGLGIFLTSIMKSKIRVASTTILITMGFYIFTSMTRIVDKLKDYEKLSPFYLYDPQKLLDTGNINTNHLIILFAIFTIGLISSLIIFNRKDI